MNKEEIASGIGMVLIVLAVFTASAAADAVVRFEPDPSTVSGVPGEEITIQIMADVDANETGIRTWQLGVDFDPGVVKIIGSNPINWEHEPFPEYWWDTFTERNYTDATAPFGEYVWMTGAHSCYTNVP